MAKSKEQEVADILSDITPCTNVPPHKLSSHRQATIGDVELGVGDPLQAHGEGVTDQEESVNPNAKKDDRLLFRYSKSGDLDLLRKLMQKRNQGDKERKEGDKFVDFINKKDIRGNSSIHYAMKEGNLEVLKLMKKEAGSALIMESML